MTNTVRKRIDGHRRRTVWLLVTIAALALVALAGSQAASSKSEAGEPVNTALPTITGTPQVGQTLSTTGGTWSSATTITEATYAWWRCNASTAACTTIPGATGSSYTLVDADAASTIRVAQKVTNSSGSTTAASEPTAPVASLKPISTVPPKITGSALVGQTVSTSGGTWSYSGSLTAVSYQWRRCSRSGDACAAVGSNLASYGLGNDDLDHTIRVAQTVTNSYGSATSVSDPTAIVTRHNEPAYITLPSISGTPQVGQRLSTNGGTWSTATSLRNVVYQWQRCDGAGANCASIGGATGSSYVLGSADLAHTIRVQQSVTNSADSATATSAPTGVVAAVNGLAFATVLPTISGTAKVGTTLATTGATWSSPTPITKVTYQWQRCATSGSSCATIPGATSSSYLLTIADLNHTIRVAQTVDNGKGPSTATSNPTPTVTTSAGAGTAPIPATSVRLPNRLVVSGVAFQPRSLRSRNTFIARFRIVDASGRPVSGALVYALGLPYSWVQKGVEVATGQDGWANIPITPTRQMPLGRGHALVLFVRTRSPGQPILGGSSARRLVQVRIG